MANQQLFLGIDCGTQGTKAIILDALSGQVLGQGAAAHTLISGANGRREQDTQQWLEAFTLATRHALLAANVDGQDILGIGVSGQQHGLVLLDDQGQVLRPAKLWCDTESTAGKRPPAGPSGRRKRLAGTPRRGHRTGLHRVQTALDQRTASRGVFPHRPHPAAPRLPQLLAHRPQLQRIRRCLRHRLFQRAHPPVGLAAAARHRPQRPPASRVAGADRRPSSRRHDPAGHRRAPGHQPATRWSPAAAATT